ncbi:MAG TPA: aminotransferase class V-fold PLP-dependent enzyme [Stellaceae bacterium]|nr:aminotransferase class V-fold PLP-dependent enzyme [Stellaceae bacterium]
MNDSSSWGAASRGAWRLDPAIAYLNHGGFGATPQMVIEEQDRWRARIERNPSHFLTYEVDAALRAALVPLASALGAAAEDVVFVENATSGLNAVLRCLDLEPGAEILITSLSYPAIRKAAYYAASRSGAHVIEAAIALPIADDVAVLRAVAARLTIRTRLAIFDHIASHSALVLPAAALTRLAHEAGARVMIDGAHAPGQIPLDLPGIGADWYVGNLHKWYFAPRSCGFLWASKAVQGLTHPLAISHGYGDGFRAEFEWTGTRDATPALATPAAIEFHTALGGGTLMARNTALARAAAGLLARRWRTETTGRLESFAAMATVRLPLAGAASAPRANALMRELSEQHRIAAAIVALGDALWVRVAAQAYNELAEYERLAAVFAARP